MIKYAEFVFATGTVSMMWDASQDLMMSMTIPHEVNRKLPPEIRSILDKTDSFRELESLVGWCKKRCTEERVVEVQSS